MTTHRFHIICNGSNTAVRQGLKSTLGGLAELPLHPEELGTVETVLAEVMNNIVEHAYEDRGVGVIEMKITPEPDALDVFESDDGRAMPGGILPSGKPANVDVPLDELPEGGFGWFLIRTLTEGIEYARRDDKNTLTFRIPLENRKSDQHRGFHS